MNSQKEGRVYTPENLTNYIAQISIEKFLVEKINVKFSTKIHSITELFEKYIRKENDNQSFTDNSINKGDKEQLEYIVELLSGLTVLDPAVGSGQFLIAALKIIEQYYITLKNLEIINWSNYKIRKEIVSKNLFGVDIEKEAIETTKNRLLLAIKELGANEKDNNVVPNIDFNLRVGNAIIGYISQSEITCSHYKDLNDCFYDENNNLFHTHKDLKKSNLTKREKKTRFLALNPFHWFHEFPKIMEKGGFDIIIENPPYISNKNLNPLEKAIFQKRYKTPKGLMNTFGIFIERSISLCHSISRNCYVIHKNFIRSNSYDLLRKFLLEHTTIEEIIDIGAEAFPSITAETVIILLKNQTPSKEHKIQIKTNFFSNAGFSANNALIKDVPQKIYLEQENYNFNLEFQHDELEIINYIKEHRTCDLYDYFEAKTCIATGNDNRFLSSHKVNDSFKKTLRGKNIGRFFIEFDGLYVNYDPKELHRARNEIIFQNPEKLIMQTISSNLTVAYDNNKYYPLSTCIAIIPKDDIDENFCIKYLLLLLNSKLMNFYYDFVFNLGANLTTEISVNNINRLPVKSHEKYGFFDTLADLMTQLNKNETLRHENKEYIEYLDDLINLLIYEIVFFSKFQSDGLNTGLINYISLYIADINPKSIKQILECIENIQNDKAIDIDIQYIKKHPWVKIIEEYFKK